MSDTPTSSAPFHDVTRFSDVLVIHSSPSVFTSCCGTRSAGRGFFRHVRRVVPHEDGPDYQDFEMETESAGGVHFSRSVRRGQSPFTISYEQILPPPLFSAGPSKLWRRTHNKLDV